MIRVTATSISECGGLPSTQNKNILPPLNSMTLAVLSNPSHSNLRAAFYLMLIGGGCSDRVTGAAASLRVTPIRPLNAWRGEFRECPIAVLRFYLGSTAFSTASLLSPSACALAMPARRNNR